mmetsp:Transcript_7739/g.11279  ORF Transcript_7739/g.11279 Transcript_7739/m.11279 type:complete len:438 (-) Transcript_7739:213-1526(-)|eukprot:CAMPEP_0195525758 /NCGR_PEP_ID=MMETSP0794_2-20130614/26361_1 /TAXON_ID=515487 /ORGANISM="Stephanopyxis turris, Strain CCMP 815" /LENGTH=437 /DNA_ID=CAMNT_0040656289 /DNA_START=32 /DNA_END=1345 /DNA_ORIENTATION=+
MTKTLRPPGSRELVEKARAEEIVAHWNANDETKYTAVSLGDKAYTEEAAKIVASYITSPDTSHLFDEVTVADLADMIAGRMEEEGLAVLKALCSAVGNGRRLVEVDLSDNAMGSKGINACQAVLEDQYVSLQRLSMCNDGLSGASMHEVADILCKATPSPLTKIHFYNNMSGDDGCEAFARILANCVNLVDVRFSGTRARAKGSLRTAKEFAALGAAGNLSNLTRLDLADNSFGTDGGAELAVAFKNCPKLTYLNLRDCILGDEGTTVVCNALNEAKCPLVHLDLSGNEITAVGAKSVARLLRSQDTLITFHCEENEMTSRGVARIASSLGANLVDVALGCNECGAIGGKALVDASERMTSLKVITIDGNMFQANEVEALETAFGEKLCEMEDNDDFEDVDADLESEEESEEEAETNEQKSNAVDDLADAIAKTHIS